ncbi:MAG: glycosyltransferase family 4 protein [Candidatus Fermentibacteraceae bacterium]|nr:glycosyltransferase family 4 protein [Candidatus Fermentibacteraceae bacterium]MBN2609173.1 glycosyltransferase family 4 protein [Candidatus Fermentibacteraceae bacterium]
MREERNRADVCMIVKNQLWNDARVKKEACTLSEMGLLVTIIAYPEEGCPEREDWDGIEVLRVPRSGSLKAVFRKVLNSAESEKKGFRTGFVSALRRNPLKKFLGQLFHSLLHQSRLLRHALATGAGVFHAHDLDTLPVCAAAAFLTSGKLVYDSHELWLESRRHLMETSRPFMALERLTESFIAPLADAVIAVTPGRAEVMREMYPGMPPPVLVANYPHLLREKPRSDEVRRSLGVWEGPKFLFLYQGILGLHRGLEELMDAAVMLRGLPIHIGFVGHDRSGGVIPCYARERDAGDMMTFHPPVPSEELPEITAAADCGLLLFQGSCLNHTYSLPNKLFEYMMAGLPVLGCDLPEISRVIESHRCGILVDASDPGSIADGMSRMASDPEQAAAMGRRGYEAARENYTWDRSAQALHSLYSDVLGRELPSPSRIEGLRS